MARERRSQPVVVSDTGLRERNEDYVDYAVPADSKHGEGGALFVLADGMGGHQAGDVASKSAVQAIKRAYAATGQNGHSAGNSAGNITGNGNLSINERLSRAIVQANKEVYRLAASRDSRSGMGTTAVAMVLRGNHLHVAYVGDSRAYVLHRATEQLEQITHDHSYVQELIDAGQLDPEDAEIHPQRKVVTRCLGRHDTIKVDTIEADLQPGDVVLLCSDGLTRPVSDKFIAETLLQQQPERAARILLDRANREGQDDPDNISMAIVEVPQAGVNTVAPPLVIKPAGPRSAKRSALYVGIVGVALMSVLAVAAFNLLGGTKQVEVLKPFTGTVVARPTTLPGATAVGFMQAMNILSPKSGEAVPAQDEPRIQLRWEDPNKEPLGSDEVYAIEITRKGCTEASGANKCSNVYQEKRNVVVADRSALKQPGTFDWQVWRATVEGTNLTYSSYDSGTGSFTWSLVPTATPTSTATPTATNTPTATATATATRVKPPTPRPPIVQPTPRPPVVQPTPKPKPKPKPPPTPCILCDPGGEIKPPK